MNELEQTIREGSKARHEFVASLKKQVISDYSQKGSTKFNIITMISKNRIFLGAFSAFSVTLFAGLLVLAYVVAPKSATLSQADTDLLQKIASANSSRLELGLGNSAMVPSANTSMNSAATDQSKRAAALVYREVNRDYNYVERTEEYTKGPLANSCSNAAYVPEDIASISSYEYYVDKKAMFPDKTLSMQRTKDGELIEYQLMDNQSTYINAGGSYTVYLKNNNIIRPLAYDTVSAPETSALSKEATGNASSSSNVATDINKMPPVTATPSPTLSIKSLFGDNAKVIGTKTENGKKYYIIEWTYDLYTDCAPASSNLAAESSVSSIGNTVKPKQVITVQAKVSDGNFKIAEQSYFKGTSKSENLIVTYAINEQTKLLSGNEQELDKFNPIKTVPIRTFDVASFNWSAANQKELASIIQKNNIKGIVFDSSIGKASGVYSNQVRVIPDFQKYQTDRDFYAQTQFGQKRYDQIVKDNSFTVDANSPLMNLSFSNVKTDVLPGVILIYSESVPIQTIINQQGMSAGTAKAVDITLDGRVISGTQYEAASTPNSVSGSGGSGATAPDAPSDQKNIQTRALYYVFKQNGFHYIAMIYVNTKTSYSPVFKSVANLEDLAKSVNGVVEPVKAL